MKIKESFILGMNCMLDLDAASAQRTMQEIMDSITDHQTGGIRVRDTSLGACFKMTGEQLAASCKRFETNHPELVQYFG